MRVLLFVLLAFLLRLVSLASLENVCRPLESYSLPSATAGTYYNGTTCAPLSLTFTKLSHDDTHPDLSSLQPLLNATSGQLQVAHYLGDDGLPSDAVSGNTFPQLLSTWFQPSTFTVAEEYALFQSVPLPALSPTAFSFDISVSAESLLLGYSETVTSHVQVTGSTHSLATLSLKSKGAQALIYVNSVLCGACFTVDSCHASVNLSGDGTGVPMNSTYFSTQEPLRLSPASSVTVDIFIIRHGTSVQPDEHLSLESTWDFGCSEECAQQGGTCHNGACACASGSGPHCAQTTSLTATHSDFSFRVSPVEKEFADVYGPNTESSSGYERPDELVLLPILSSTGYGLLVACGADTSLNLSIPGYSEALEEAGMTSALEYVAKVPGLSFSDHSVARYLTDDSSQSILSTVSDFSGLVAHETGFLVDLPQGASFLLGLLPPEFSVHIVSNTTQRLGEHHGDDFTLTTGGMETIYGDVSGTGDLTLITEEETHWVLSAGAGSGPACVNGDGDAVTFPTVGSLYCEAGTFSLASAEGSYYPILEAPAELPASTCYLPGATVTMRGTASQCIWNGYLPVPAVREGGFVTCAIPPDLSGTPFLQLRGGAQLSHSIYVHLCTVTDVAVVMPPEVVVGGIVLPIGYAVDGYRLANAPSSFTFVMCCGDTEKQRACSIDNAEVTGSSLAIGALSPTTCEVRAVLGGSVSSGSAIKVVSALRDPVSLTVDYDNGVVSVEFEYTDLTSLPASATVSWLCPEVISASVFGAGSFFLDPPVVSTSSECTLTATSGAFSASTSVQVEPASNAHLKVLMWWEGENRGVMESDTPRLHLKAMENGVVVDHQFSVTFDCDSDSLSPLSVGPGTYTLSFSGSCTATCEAVSRPLRALAPSVSVATSTVNGTVFAATPLRIEHSDVRALKWECNSTLSGNQISALPLFSDEVALCRVVGDSVASEYAHVVLEPAFLAITAPAVYRPFEQFTVQGVRLDGESSVVSGTAEWQCNQGTSAPFPFSGAFSADPPVLPAVDYDTLQCSLSVTSGTLSASTGLYAVQNETLLTLFVSVDNIINNYIGGPEAEIALSGTSAVAPASFFNVTASWACEAANGTALETSYEPAVLDGTTLRAPLPTVTGEPMGAIYAEILCSITVASGTLSATTPLYRVAPEAISGTVTVSDTVSFGEDFVTNGSVVTATVSGGTLPWGTPAAGYSSISAHWRCKNSEWIPLALESEDEFDVFENGTVFLDYPVVTNSSGSAVVNPVLCYIEFFTSDPKWHFDGPVVRVVKREAVQLSVEVQNTVNYVGTVYHQNGHKMLGSISGSYAWGNAIADFSALVGSISCSDGLSVEFHPSSSGSFEVYLPLFAVDWASESPTCSVTVSSEYTSATASFTASPLVPTSGIVTLRSALQSGFLVGDAEVSWYGKYPWNVIGVEGLSARYECVNAEGAVAVGNEVADVALTTVLPAPQVLNYSLPVTCRVLMRSYVRHGTSSEYRSASFSVAPNAIASFSVSAPTLYELSPVPWTVSDAQYAWGEEAPVASAVFSAVFTCYGVNQSISHGDLLELPSVSSTETECSLLVTCDDGGYVTTASATVSAVPLAEVQAAVADGKLKSRPLADPLHTDGFSLDVGATLRYSDDTDAVVSSGATVTLQCRADELAAYEDVSSLDLGTVATGSFDYPSMVDSRQCRLRASSTRLDAVYTSASFELAPAAIAEASVAITPLVDENGDGIPDEEVSNVTYAVTASLQNGTAATDADVSGTYTWSCCVLNATSGACFDGDSLVELESKPLTSLAGTANIPEIKSTSLCELSVELYHAVNTISPSVSGADRSVLLHIVGGTSSSGMGTGSKVLLIILLIIAATLGAWYGINKYFNNRKAEGIAPPAWFTAAQGAVMTAGAYTMGAMSNMGNSVRSKFGSHAVSNVELPEAVDGGIDDFYMEEMDF